MKQHTILFYECEHSGDLEAYLSDMTICGATIIDTSIDVDEEVADVSFTTDNLERFMKSFRESDAYGFSSWDEM